MEYADPAPDIVVRFDDVLTTGSHFEGIEIVLGERFPGVTVFGLFLARAVPPPNDETFDLDFRFDSDFVVHGRSDPLRAAEMPCLWECGPRCTRRELFDTVVRASVLR